MTQAGKQKNKTGSSKALIVIFIAICIAPLLFLPIFGNEEAESADSDVSLPTWNTYYFRDLGEYFSYKFAFRRELVDADAHFVSRVFQQSKLDQKSGGVMQGKDGWLFYTEDLPDYLGQKTLSDYQIGSASWNLKIMQEQLKQKGVDFLFTIAPNKATLYPQYLSGKWHVNADDRNHVRLEEQMKEDGINYVNLYDIFRNRKEVLYHKTDSHWNNKGAALVNEKLLTAAGFHPTDYTDEPYEERDDFQGDLFRMLFPTSTDHEKEVYYRRPSTFTYAPVLTGGKEQVVTDTKEAKKMATKNEGGEGKVAMYRDSFGISLIPFMAEDIEEGHFSQVANPYELQPAVDEGADVFIFEIGERHLANLTTDGSKMPQMPMNEREISQKQAKDCSEYRGEVEASYDMLADQIRVEGRLDSHFSKTDTKVYVNFSKPGYEYTIPAYRVTAADDSEYGLLGYGNEDAMKRGQYDLRILYENDGILYRSPVMGTYEKL